MLSTPQHLPRPPRPSPRQALLATVLLLVAGLLAYSNSFSPALHFDDRTVITENASIRDLANLPAVLSPPPVSGVGGRPVSNLSFALNYRLSGLHLWSYHALNLALHLAAACTLFGLVRRTLRLPSLAPRFGSDATLLAFAVAVLWLLHPVQTQVVTYLSQRTEGLMGLFYLLTLYGFVRGTEKSRPRLWHTLAIATCALGMASKQAMVTAPMLVLLYDRTFVSGSFRDAWRRHTRFYLGLAASWIVLGFCLLRLRDQNVGYALGVSPFDYALTACRALLVYLKLSFWPHPLVFDYGPNFLRTVGAAAPYALPLAALLLGTLFALWRRPALGFLGAAFFLLLAPTSSLVPIALQPIAENRLYLALAAPLTLLALGLHRLVPGPGRWLFVPFAVTCGLLTHHRNEAYRDEISLWSDTVAKAPDNARAHYNLGLAFSAAGRLPDALAHYERALALRPDYAEAHCNLGLVLLETSRPQEAIPHLELAVQAAPELFEAHYNLGNARLALRQFSAALAPYAAALRLNPRDAKLHNNFAFALLQTGRLDAAIAEFSAAVRLQPDHADWHFNLAIAQAGAGRTAEAIAACEQALRLDPHHAKAAEKLARLRDGGR